MAPRPVVPKDLSRFPDFPQRKPGQSQEHYDSTIIAYWTAKERERKKQDKQKSKCLKMAYQLNEELDKLNNEEIKVVLMFTPNSAESNRNHQ